MLKKSQQQPQRVSKLRGKKLESRIKAKINTTPEMKARNERFVTQYQLNSRVRNSYDPFLV